MKTELTTIKKIVERHFNCDLSIKSRNNGLPDKKKIYSMLCRKHLFVTFKEIGMQIGCDHATVIHQVKKGSDFYDTDKIFRQQFDEVDAKIPRIDKQAMADTARLRNRLAFLYRETYLIRKELKRRGENKSVKV